MPQPEIVVMLRESPAVDFKEFTDEDAAAIRAGDKVVYDIAIIEPREDHNWENPQQWEELDYCGNYIGDPGCDNVYSTPRLIPDEYVRYYATDMWAHQVGINPGALVHHGGQIHYVMSAEHIDQDYGSIGYATGYLICRSTTGGAPTRIWVEDVTRVLELTGSSKARTEPMTYSEFVELVTGSPNWNGNEDA